MLYRAEMSLPIFLFVSQCEVITLHIDVADDIDIEESLGE